MCATGTTSPSTGETGETGAAPAACPWDGVPLPTDWVECQLSSARCDWQGGYWTRGTCYDAYQRWLDGVERAGCGGSQFETLECTLTELVDCILDDFPRRIAARDACETDECRDSWDLYVTSAYDGSIAACFDWPDPAWPDCEWTELQAHLDERAASEAAHPGCD